MKNLRAAPVACLIAAFAGCAALPHKHGKQAGKVAVQRQVARAPASKTVQERVKDILIEQLGVDPWRVKSNARLKRDLHVDSLDSVELVMAFEEEFRIKIADSDVEKLQTVGEIEAYLIKRTKRD